MDRPTAPVPASSPFGSHDAKTADALLRSFGGRLFAYFRCMLGSESAAKRALSGTLAAALPEAGRARDLDQYGPRLFMLAHAECRRYQPAEAVGAGQHWAVVTGSGNPVLPEIARRAVARLAPDVREAYLLSAPYNNLTLPQMAEILGLGLDAAADLRAQAGLDFVRAVALCATEAGFIQFGGAELRIRVEESLEREAAEPPPTPERAPEPVPQVQPPRTPLPPPNSLPSALPSSVALPPPSDLPPPQRQTLPPRPAPTPAEPAVPEPENPTRLDRALPGGFRGGPDHAQGYGGEPEYYDEPEPGPAYDAHGGYRSSPFRTGPLRAITGPMMLGDSTPRARRRRRVLAWAGGGIAAAAVAVIGWQALASGPDNTITLTHGDVPATAVPVAPGPGVPAGSEAPSRRPTAGQSSTPAEEETFGPGSGSGATAGGTAPAAPQPTAASGPASAPATHAPAPRPTSSKPAPAPTSASPAPTKTSPTPTPPTASPTGSP